MAVYGTVGGCSWTNCQGAVDAFLEAKEGKIYWKEGSKSKTEEKCRKQLGLAPTSSVNNSTMPATTATDATGGAITSAAASVTSAGASAAATTSSQALGNALVWEQGGVSGLLAAFLMMFL